MPGSQLMYLDFYTVVISLLIQIAFKVTECKLEGNQDVLIAGTCKWLFSFSVCQLKYDTFFIMSFKNWEWQKEKVLGK